MAKFTTTQLWKIFIPDNFAKISGETGETYQYKIPMKHHIAWDSYVSKKAGGLTILFHEMKGKFDLENQIVSEPMIPVLVAACGQDLIEILEFTKKHYEQKSIFYYLVSNEACIYR